MKNLNCTVKDSDDFSNELLTEFIERTKGTSLVKNPDEPYMGIDLVFIDADLRDLNIPTGINPSSQVVVVSSDIKYVHSLFKDQIADYLFKPDLSYANFLAVIEKVRKREGKV